MTSRHERRRAHREGGPVGPGTAQLHAGEVVVTLMCAWSAGGKCTEPGIVRPVLTIRSFVGEVPGLEAELDLHLCHEHAHMTKASDLVDGRGWEMLAVAYAASRGNRIALRSLTSLSWRPIGQSPAFDKARAGT